MAGVAANEVTDIMGGSQVQGNRMAVNEEPENKELDPHSEKRHGLPRT